MKFAKELEEDLVPEWRAKYLDYKGGKKKLKAVSRALRSVERSTPSTRPEQSPFVSSTFRQAPFYTFQNRSGQRLEDQREDGGRRASSATFSSRPAWQHHGEDRANATGALPIPNAAQERTPLQTMHNGRQRDAPQMTRYGSIVASPPEHSPTLSRKTAGAPSLRLPGPALDPSRATSTRDGRGGSQVPGTQLSPRPGSQYTDQDHGSTPYEIGTSTQPNRNTLSPRHRSIFTPKRINSMPGDQDGGSLRPYSSRRMLSFRSPRPGQEDIAMNAYREVDFRQADFFNFLDKEMEKIETFYKQKEEESTERLKLLREQLHIMRDRRLDEIVHEASLRKRSTAQKAGQDADYEGASNAPAHSNEGVTGNGKANFFRPVNRMYGKATGSHVGKTFKALQELGTPNFRATDERRDYVRRTKQDDVPYRTAKRKLKIAMVEFYRGLEMLKSYAILNRTGFRKINKKFDKIVNARPTGRYMSEKVNDAYFVNSSIVESHIQVVEDLYARYFERGNHKLAVGKLRARTARAGDYTGSVFRNGLLLATGAVFGIQGLVYGAQLLFSSDPTLATHTSYLLQIYAGYFMMLFLSLLFCLACRIWQRAKVNYAFIFEFDTRHHVDWRQLSEIPCVLWFCLGLTLWLNFNRFTDDSFYVYWPVVLIGVSVIILFAPVKLFYYRSRFWFINANFRLVLAGLFPVEFRDFFLGDMYCSQTYALGNLELFFCLYAQDWRNPPMCNSSHSRLLGFFSTLPGIWRALQCLRRYHDTKNVFPHLVNCGKYMATICYYMSLSLFRIDKTYSLRALFIFFATINAIYCSVWDIVMDWSLVDPAAKHRFLRSTLAFKYTWWYYIAMILDPILRFNWIFYAIYADNLQHSSLISFFVAFSEVLRRGIWTLFRVENEHCTNVGRFRASRDVPLPYSVEASEEDLAQKDTEQTEGEAQATHDVEAQETAKQRQGARLTTTPSRASGANATQIPVSHAGSPNVRQRKTFPSESPVVRAFTRVGTMLHSAHAQDFERRRRPEAGGAVGHGLPAEDEDDDDDDDDDNEATDSDEAEMAQHRALRHGQHDGTEEHSSWAGGHLSANANGAMRGGGAGARGEAEEDVAGEAEEEGLLPASSESPELLFGRRVGSG